MQKVENGLFLHPCRGAGGVQKAEGREWRFCIPAGGGRRAFDSPLWLN